ncbi:MAG TPA: aminotransferase class I/II-fold pyridoxal phosphate-dependent enzyme [Saprospiraceae bacterium]|nr:aminotransferase class I/II-fold pyridoxal phosphate-dependent enzyme [Saprospiraceae bacterium]
MKVEHLNGRRIRTPEGNFYYCSGTDYLGMAYHEGLKESIIEAYAKYGLNYGSTRKHGLFDDIYERAETIFANWLGLEAALTVSSGTLAGQLVRNFVRAHSYALIELPRLHPALKDIYEDQIAQRMENKAQERLIDQINRHPAEKIALLTVAMDPLTSQPADFSFLQAVEGKELLLILDDTHGLGVLGETGAGFIELFPSLRSEEVIVIGSLAKGISLPGGLIAGPQKWVKAIQNSGHFLGSSPISPAYLEAFSNQFAAYQQRRLKLKDNIELLKSEIQEKHKLGYFPDFPIFILPEEYAGERLKELGIWISSIRYPYPHSPLLNRLILNGAHEKEDILQVTARLNQIL